MRLGQGTSKLKRWRRTAEVSSPCLLNECRAQADLIYVSTRCFLRYVSGIVPEQNVSVLLHCLVVAHRIHWFGVEHGCGEWRHARCDIVRQRNSSPRFFGQAMGGKPSNGARHGHRNLWLVPGPDGDL